MKHQILRKISALMLALAMLLSLCSCAVSPQELLEQLEQSQLGNKGEESTEEPLEETAPSESSGAQNPPETNQ